MYVCQVMLKRKLHELGYITACMFLPRSRDHHAISYSYSIVNKEFLTYLCHETFCEQWSENMQLLNKFNSQNNCTLSQTKINFLNYESSLLLICITHIAYTR